MITKYKTQYKTLNITVIVLTEVFLRSKTGTETDVISLYPSRSPGAPRRPCIYRSCVSVWTESVGLRKYFLFFFKFDYFESREVT